MSDGGPVWWEDAVVYEVYPRSFADANGDGIGDLPGLRRGLGYLADLGVDAIWLTPFYPSPLADGGYDVSDYTAVDPRLGTLDDFDLMVREAATHDIRVVVDLVPNHCSIEHPLFQAALAAPPGSRERDRFFFRDGRGPSGDEPPNNWPSSFGGSAWTRITEADGRPGQWYLHLYDTGQPDWNWHDKDVPALFEEVIRFWLDRGVAGLRVDVAHGIFKDPDLPDVITSGPLNGPSPYRHRPELHELYRTWRGILDSYPATGYPGQRTAIGEVWYDSPGTLRPYLVGDGLPQVFNFSLILAGWQAAAFRDAIDGITALTDGSRAPWVVGNHDVPRPVSRYQLDAGFTPQMISELVALGTDPDGQDLARGARRARAVALLLLALPGSAYIYQGEELGLPEVTGIPDAARQDPNFRRTGGRVPGRDGCRVPLPWSQAGPAFGFSATGDAAPWLPQPSWWGRYSVEAQQADDTSFLTLYRAALRLRREHPALGRGVMQWHETSPDQLLCFTREPGFVFAANFGTAPAALPTHGGVLLASEPGLEIDAVGGELPPGTAVWMSAP